MQRRDFLLAGLFGAAFLKVTENAFAQAFDASPVDGGVLVDRFANPGTLDRVMLDVAYVHSWRVELAPRGYEAKPGWRELAFQNRQMIWQRLGDGQARVEIEQAYNSGVVSNYETAMLDNYKKQSSEFSSFLETLGLSPDGRAAVRILESLRDYGILNVFVLRDDVEAAGSHSFYWPFC